MDMILPVRVLLYAYIHVLCINCHTHRSILQNRMLHATSKGIIQQYNNTVVYLSIDPNSKTGCYKAHQRASSNTWLRLSAIPCPFKMVVGLTWTLMISFLSQATRTLIYYCLTTMHLSVYCLHFIVISA